MKYIVNGNPYISVNKVIINADIDPNVRQSLADLGLKKLNINIMNTTELSTTSDHNP